MPHAVLWALEWHINSVCISHGGSRVNACAGLWEHDIDIPAVSAWSWLGPHCQAASDLSGFRRQESCVCSAESLEPACSSFTGNNSLQARWAALGKPRGDGEEIACIFFTSCTYIQDYVSPLGDCSHTLKLCSTSYPASTLRHCSSRW